MHVCVSFFAEKKLHKKWVPSEASGSLVSYEQACCAGPGSAKNVGLTIVSSSQAEGLPYPGISQEPIGFRQNC